jgi:RNA recognition motif-containing protein
MTAPRLLILFNTKINKFRPAVHSKPILKYDIIIDKVPGSVKTQELEDYFNLISETCVSSKIAYQTETDYVCLISIPSLDGLLKVFNTIPLPKLWPDIYLRAHLYPTTCSLLNVVAVEITDTKLKLEEARWIQLKSYFSRFGKVLAVNLYMELDGAYIIYESTEDAISAVSHAPGKIDFGSEALPYKCERM